VFSAKTQSVVGFMGWWERRGLHLQRVYVLHTHTHTHTQHRQRKQTILESKLNKKTHTHTRSLINIYPQESSPTDRY